MSELVYGRAGHRASADSRLTYFNRRAELLHPAPRSTTALRRRLLRLSVRLWWHPYWETAPSVPAARTELRQLVRARGAVRAA
ncbi:hypothetical protein [Streptomyces sp. NPDC058665]|uniref:hypothetical protein n=1 Tax=Streptomyces sp. NPDC058665 TaxID=3346586 RepID=UPI003665F1E9